MGIFTVLYAGASYFNQQNSYGDHRRDLLGVAAVAGVWYIVIPIGLLLKTKWGYYGGLVLSLLISLAIPIGTLIGILTLKALLDCKAVFRVG